MVYTSLAFGLVIMMINLWNTSTRSITPSAEVIGETEDLLTLILLRLPVKSLLQFKCVSKKWKSLISTPYFSITHTRRNPNPISSSLLVLKNQTLCLLSLGHENNPKAGFRISALDFFNTTPNMNIRILGSSNGLMLSYTTSVFNANECAYCVSNITTRKFVKLPPPGKIINKPILGTNLAFDPSNSPHFKVMCVGQSFIKNEKSCQIEIYSSETGLWKPWTGFFSNPLRFLEVFERGVFCNGAMHWLCMEGDSFYFVLENETMKTLPVPPMHTDIYTTTRLRFLGQSGGYLHLVDIEANLFQSPPMDMYEMRRDYSGWFLKYRIDLNDIGSVFPDMVKEMLVNTQYSEDENDISIHLSRCYLCSVLSVRRAADGESMEIIIFIPRRIVSYNPKYNSIKVLLCFDHSVQLQDFKWYDVHQFIETLSWI